MLSSAKLIAFIASAQPARAKKFYGDTLGLPLVSDDQFAVVFNCAGTQLRIQKVQSLQPHSFTSLGWRVRSIRKSVSALAKQGIVFERYGFMDQDELGVWQAPSGAKIAWFRDPDGNLLSLTEMGSASRRAKPAKAPKPKARRGASKSATKA